jgi:fructose-1,6-bisphosphatase I
MTGTQENYRAIHEGNHLPTNIQVHLRREESLHPEATGALTSILSDLSLVAKSVSYLVNRAGIGDIYGSTGRINIQGEHVLKLDESANEKFIYVFRKIRT